MGDDKVQELLLKLLEDMSYVKAKLDSIDAQKLSRVDLLEARLSSIVMVYIMWIY